MSGSRTTGPPARDTIGGAHRSLRDQVYLEVRERIIDGRWPSGHRIVERELAEELGVSRIPVREALQRLETEGFVTAAARRGAFVAGPRPPGGAGGARRAAAGPPAPPPGAPPRGPRGGVGGAAGPGGYDRRGRKDP
ncbi:GntR family transcriptional regulator, partial [Streptomyces sp. NPDC058953]|uniref:GntR family transcriptional regulator n=1 Tax=Streptomyces sp. NPDC058953 TaxID=3346676 RepID=UPI00367EBCE6